MRAIGMREQGMKVSEVACRLGVWPGSPYRWKDAYKRAGKEALQGEVERSLRAKRSGGRLLRSFFKYAELGL